MVFGSLFKKYIHRKQFLKTENMKMLFLKIDDRKQWQTTQILRESVNIIKLLGIYVLWLGF